MIDDYKRILCLCKPHKSGNPVDLGRLQSHLAQIIPDCDARPLPCFNASDVALLGQMGIKL